MSSFNFYKVTFICIMYMKHEISITERRRLENKSYSLHQWSTNDLKQLMNISNHYIKPNKFGMYEWTHIHDGCIVRRCIKDYESFKSCYAVLRFWISLWGSEHDKRIQYQERMRISRECKRMDQAFHIAHSTHLKTSEKVKRIRQLLLDAKQEQIASIAGISVRQVIRILNNKE